MGLDFCAPVLDPAAEACFFTLFPTLFPTGVPFCPLALVPPAFPWGAPDPPLNCVSAPIMPGLPEAPLRAVLVDFFASGSSGMGMGETQRGAGVSCVLLSSWAACDAELFRFFGTFGSSETKSTGKQRARKVYTSCWQREEMMEARSISGNNTRSEAATYSLRPSVGKSYCNNSSIATAPQATLSLSTGQCVCTYHYHVCVCAKTLNGHSVRQR